MDNEIWKDIDGYENHYQISNKGVVKSLKRIRRSSYRNALTKERILKQWDRGNKYLFVVLQKDSICKTYNVHRLVANAFLPNTENKPEVNHKNGIKNDNRVENLEWCTKSENGLHSYKTGLSKSPCAMKGRLGINNPKSILIYQFSIDGIFVNSFIGIANASRITNINRTSIINCANGVYKTAGGYIWSYNDKLNV